MINRNSLNISKANAFQIVTQISEAIQNDVNLMNEKGIIIASTDKARLGQFHGGAYKVITEGLERLVIHFDGEYTGVRKGINLPILQAGAIVGVIGVTGEEAEVLRYGTVIKKMTEILLLESGASERKRIEERVRRRFVEKWISQKDIVSSADFVKWGHSLGIDVSVPRRTVIIGVEQQKALGETADESFLFEQIDEEIEYQVTRHRHGICSRLGALIMCFLPLKANRELSDFTQRLSTLISQKFNCTLNIGIDEKTEDIFTSCGKAEKAIEASIRLKSQTSIFYDQIDIDIFLTDLKESIKRQYLKRLFSGIKAENMSETVNLIDTYIRSNGSLDKMGSELDIHKNTVQYKLRRIFDLTGYDIRKLPDTALMYIGSVFHKSLKSQE